MNLDAFEQRLKAQPLRSIPPDWRQEVLREARRTAAPAASESATSLRQWLREWLWPSPLAWGALAACWVAVLGLNLAAQPSAAQLAEARANARLALAYQALVREFSAAESAGITRPPPPVDRAPRGRSDRSQARPEASTAFVPNRGVAWIDSAVLPPRPPPAWRDWLGTGRATLSPSDLPAEIPSFLPASADRSAQAGGERDGVRGAMRCLPPTDDYDCLTLPSTQEMV